MVTSAVVNRHTGIKLYVGLIHRVIYRYQTQKYGQRKDNYKIIG